MVSIDEIKYRYGRICRSCINRIYHVKLQQKDCVYGTHFLEQCARCGEMKHIVVGFSLSGQRKLFWKK